MEVILLEKIANLGSLGDKVSIKNGYARNYLIPQGKAVVATAKKIAEFEVRRAELEKAAAEKLAVAQKRAEALSKLSITIAHKAGDEGRLFGSVTNFDIAEELSKMGYEVTKSQIRMPKGPIKTVGDSPVSVSLHTDVLVDVQVAVYGESA
jgi:large subunit ribosomal protein L9